MVVVQAAADAVVAASLEPYLGGVHDVLEDGIGRQGDGGDGIEVLEGQPHGQDDVFLGQRLPSGDAAVVVGPDDLAQHEVGGTHADAGQGEEEFELVVLFPRLEELFEGAAHENGQHQSPDVIGQDAPAEEQGVELRGGILDEPGEEQRQEHGGPHALGHAEHGFKEGHVHRAGRDDRQHHRSEHYDGDAAQEDVGREKGHAAAEHAGNDGRRRRRGREGRHAHALRDGGMPRQADGVEDEAHGHLNPEQDQQQRMEPEITRRNVAEGQQKHGGEQPRGDWGELGEEAVPQRAHHDGDEQGPLFERTQQVFHLAPSGSRIMWSLPHHTERWRGYQARILGGCGCLSCEKSAIRYLPAPAPSQASRRNVPKAAGSTLSAFRTLPFGR